MASRAILVGCDAYPHVDGGDLAGAVADALAMRDWLTDPAGGGLHAADVQLLAAPSTRGVVPPASVVRGPATAEYFLDVIEELAGLRATQDDRLFVYFAGHGCQTDPQNQSVSEDALVFSDFKRPPAGCVSMAWLERRLRALDYGEFFIFCDACRDFPFDRPFRFGGFGFDVPQRKVRPYHPRGHIFQAALPGGEARGAEIDGLVSGQFTRALLQGLAGTGTAKWFDPTAEQPHYEVRWDRLCSWVQQKLGTPLNAPADGDPVLCSFDDGWFSDIKLKVVVEPAQPRPSSRPEVRVEFDNFTDPGGGAIMLPGPFPYAQAVPPRRHKIFGREKGLRWGLKVVDAYVDTDVLLVLPREPPAALFGGDRVTRSGGSAPRLVPVSIGNRDPTAVVELVDLGGTRLAIGVGTIAADVSPGSYVARLLLPGRLPAEHPVEVLTDGSVMHTLDLDAEPPRPLPDSGIRATGVARLMAGRGSATLGLTQPAAGTRWEVYPARPAEALLPPRSQPGPSTQIFAVEPGDVLRTPDRVVEVPIIAGVHTSVEFRVRAPLVVRLVDLPLLEGPAGQFLARAQAFLESRMSEAGDLLLQRTQSLGVRSEVARALRREEQPGSRSASVASFLASSWPAGEVLSGQLWAVRTQTITR